MYKEIIDNLESIHGALLRMTGPIQAEASLKIMKKIISTKKEHEK